jgi:hypothetical protein
VTVLFPTADEDFIGLNGLAIAAKRADTPVLHRFAYTMRQEPSGFHAALEHPLDLTGRKTLLASAHKVDDLQPEVQRQMAVLENRTHANGESAPARVALAESDTAALALQPPNALFVAVSTMGAYRAFRPQKRLNVSESRFIVVEMGCTQNRLSHEMSP